MRGVQVGRKRSRHAVAEHDDEEYGEGDREADGEEVGKDEIPERQSLAGLPGVL